MFNLGELYIVVGAGLENRLNNGKGGVRKEPVKAALNRPVLSFTDRITAFFTAREALLGGLMMLVIVLAAWQAIFLTEKRTHQQIEERLGVTLNAAHASLTTFYNSQRKAAKIWESAWPGQPGGSLHQAP